MEEIEIDDPPLPPSKRLAVSNAFGLPSMSSPSLDVPLLRKPWNSLDNKTAFDTFGSLVPTPTSRDTEISTPLLHQFPTGSSSNDLDDNVNFPSSLKDFKHQKGTAWTAIIEEEKDKELANKFEEVAVQHSLVIKRGSESYSVSRSLSKKLKRKRGADSDQSQSKVEESSAVLAEDPESELSDISDTGLDEDDKLFIAENVKNLKPRESDTNVSNPQQNLRKRTSFSKLAKVLENVKDGSFGKFISVRLREKNKSLIDRCVLVLGREYCLRMFRKTLKIEYQGGLKIKNNSRRRTPGGVFLYMIRMDKNNSRDQLDRIFTDNAEPEKNSVVASRQNVPTTGLSLLDSLKQKMTNSSRDRFGTRVNHIKPPVIKNESLGLRTGGQDLSEKRKSSAISEQKRKKAFADLDASSYRINAPSSVVQQVDKRADSIISYDDLF